MAGIGFPCYIIVAALVPVWEQIDGEPVLKANNYDLESGEQSIFDVELNRAPHFCWPPAD